MREDVFLVSGKVLTDFRAALFVVTAVLFFGEPTLLLFADFLIQPLVPSKEGSQGTR